MAEYPLPSWLTPQAAQGWGELAGQAARARLNAGLERDRMAQQSAQFAIEANQRSQELAAQTKAHQDALNYEHIVDQQKIAIDQAYKQQQLALSQQDEQLAQQQFALKAADAARKFTANQNFQKAILPKEQGGEGLSATEAALKYMAPFMTGTEMGRLSAIPKDFKPGATTQIPGASSEGLVQVAPNRWEKYATIPQTITNAPTAMDVTNSAGDTIGYEIQLQGQKPHYQSKTQTKTSPMDVLRQRLQQKAGAQYKTRDDVVKAFKAGKLTRDEATKILNEQFGVPLK
jgi:hypothetical protein